MATNATTWFYREPETGRPYLIAERVNHSFWNNRITHVAFECVNAEPPYRLVGVWGYDDIEVEIEYEINRVFILRMMAEETKETKAFVIGCREILGFKPTVSYTDADGRFVTEWYVTDTERRLQEVQGNPSFKNVRRYKK